ncbi:cytochrome P450 2H1-like [Ostrea edulis]|uniref:cytochrome P450 2H1-like n=1 Tax=Ostrea edulis TaxID=37623 RepID=UPI0024AF64D2|nr:cytochrome P450 2H1-like [Ostrea edulis]XP_056021513.1 cytochrome P450 2H1-like [Ostrea edulis]
MVMWSLFLAFVVILLYVWWKKTSRDPALPPGPPTVPFVGNLFSMSPDSMLESFQTYRKKYGDVFSLITGTKTMVIVNGLDTIRDIFIKHGDIVSERPDIFVAKLAHYKGVISASGELWKEHRSFSLNALREFGFGKRSLESKIMEEVGVLVQELQSKNGEPFNIHTLMAVCISNVMCSISFGRRFEHDDKHFQFLIHLISENVSNANVIFLASIFPFLRYVPGDPLKVKKVSHNTDVIREYLFQIIKDHEESFDENNVRDFIDVYLKKLKSEESNPSTTYDVEQLMCVVKDLFFAGTETTTTILLWFAVFMIRNPEVQTKMRKEINDVVGSSRYPSMDDKQNLPYSDAVLHEALRRGCIAPLAVPHGLKTDLKYKEFNIPKDVMLIPNLYSILFDPDIFEDPETFRPERFLDDHGNLINTDKVVTFSVGRRVCLGESLARMELFLFATTLVQRFQILPADPAHLPSLDGDLGVTYCPKEFSLRAISI